MEILYHDRYSLGRDSNWAVPAYWPGQCRVRIEWHVSPYPKVPTEIHLSNLWETCVCFSLVLFTHFLSSPSPHTVASCLPTRYRHTPTLGHSTPLTYHPPSLQQFPSGFRRTSHPILYTIPVNPPTSALGARFISGPRTIMNITVLWDVTLYSLVQSYRRFGGIFCFHLQDVLT